MERPCVRVPRSAGERVRRELADADVIDTDAKIAVSDGWLYIPVTDTDNLPVAFPVEHRSVEPRNTQTLPGDILGEAPSYERLGDIALVDEDDPDCARRVATALMQSSLPIRSVLNARSKVKGEHRIREWELLAGEETETVHREYGVELLLDVTKVYFSPRLATERRRVVEQVTPDEHVFDMFAGVGPFAIPIAKRGAEVVAVDLNEAAVAYLEKNARRNEVASRIAAIHGDVRDVGAEYAGWADRIIMNLPHSAAQFLETAGHIAGDDAIIHYYDIQPDGAPFSPGEQAIRATLGSMYDIEILERKEVRSYAPHEVNICLDVRLTAR